MQANNSANLKQYINKAKERLKTILEHLQWTEAGVLQHFNTNSKALLETTKSELEEPTLPESCAQKNTVILTQSELQQLLNDDTAQVPQKFSDLQLNFTPEQKLQIYEHVVACTGKCTEPEIEVPALNQGQTTFAEIVALKRREKKNRRRHRTSKPTHIEEVRGLVELQMQALQQYVETQELEQRKQRRRDISVENIRRSRKRSRHRRRSKSRERFDIKKERCRSRSHSHTKWRHKRRSRSNEYHKKHKHYSRSRSRSRSARRDNERINDECKRHKHHRHNSYEKHHHKQKSCKRERTQSRERHRHRHKSQKHHRR